MGDVRGHAVVPICASVYAARVLPLLFVFGGAGLRPRGGGSPYPFFFALIESSTSTSMSKSEEVVRGSLLIADINIFVKGES